MWSHSISQTITVGSDGNAHCVQRVAIQNPHHHPVLIAGPIQLQFSGESRNFAVVPGTNERFSPSIMDEKNFGFYNQLYLDCGDNIPAQSSLEFELTYDWPGFLKGDEFPELIIVYNSVASLTIRIIPPDNRFVDHYLLVTKDEIALKRDIDYRVTDQGQLLIEREISPDNPDRIQIIADVRSVPLEVVEQVAKYRQDSLSSGFCVLLILHLLRDFLPFIESLQAPGVSNSDIFTVGIPYSTKENVYLFLRHNGYNIRRVRKEDYSTFMRAVSSVLDEAFRQCLTNGKKLIIIEDGGYAVPLVHDDDSNFHQFAETCHGAVEQTRNGIWADKEVSDTVGLRFPVINVAESRIKLELESPLIGNAVVTNIRNLLSELGDDIINKDVGLVGYGSIGKEVARTLVKYDLRLTIFDDDPEKLKAVESGIEVVHTSEELMRNRDIIIGCSGHKWVQTKELKNINRSVYFVNATSKLKEIDYKHFNDAVEAPTRLRRFGSEYRLRVGHKPMIRLLADGFPVNFFGESVPDQQIQFIPALLLSSACYLATAELQKEIVPVPDALQEEIEKLMSS